MKIKHILFPVDFSDSSRALDRQVEWLSKQFDAKVTLLHVFEIPATWYGITEACAVNVECMQQMAGDSRRWLQNYPIDIPVDRLNRVVAEGDAALNISTWAENNNVDLIVMANRGYGALRRLLLGSVTMKLLHDTNCPIWTYTQDESNSTKPVGVSKIVCALEMTREAIPLLRFAQEMAREFGASVHIVHSVPETESRPYRYFDMDLHSYLKECAAKEIAKAQQEAQTDFPITITDGFIGQDAAMVATEQQADLIVIGRGRTQDLLGTLRTHAYDIIRRAPCPVLSYCLEAKSTVPERAPHSEAAFSVS
jgi:nucleotide-binding universal stress UspA family protein